MKRIRQKPREASTLKSSKALDLRGTLGIAKDVPVGFENIRMRYIIEAPEATAEQLASLRAKTEQYCVVMQTLHNPPEIRVEWLGDAA